MDIDGNDDGVGGDGGSSICGVGILVSVSVIVLVVVMMFYKRYYEFGRKKYCHNRLTKGGGRMTSCVAVPTKKSNKIRI